MPQFHLNMTLFLSSLNFQTKFEASSLLILHCDNLSKQITGTGSVLVRGLRTGSKIGTGCGNRTISAQKPAIFEACKTLTSHRTKAAPSLQPGTLIANRQNRFAELAPHIIRHAGHAKARANILLATSLPFRAGIQRHRNCHYNRIYLIL